MLQGEFREKNLDKLFKKYDRKVQDGYFSMFLLLQIALNVIHISVLITEAIMVSILHFYSRIVNYYVEKHIY